MQFKLTTIIQDGVLYVGARDFANVLDAINDVFNTSEMDKETAKKFKEYIEQREKEYAKVNRKNISNTKKISPNR